MFSNRIGLFLGHTKLFYPLNNYRNFYVYIHEKGQFWPRGKFYPISILPNEYKVLKFQKKRQVSKKENNNCNDKNEFSFTSCINNFIRNKVGCSLKLFDNQDSYSKCFKKSQWLKTKVQTIFYNWLMAFLSVTLLECFKQICCKQLLLQGITSLGQKYSNEKSQRSVWLLSQMRSNQGERNFRINLMQIRIQK